MKKFIIIVIAVAVIVVGGLAWRSSTRGASNGDGLYEFVEVTRGNLENTVSATGTLEAVGTVEVGAQVSGRLAEILVDYNDNVREGQVLAVLDTTMLAASVRDVEATLMKAEAQYEQSLNDHERVSELRAQELVSEVEFSDSETNVKVAKAALLSARAALDRAHANLGYAVIHSPIDGTVIARNVETGQTVAASLSAPVLFIIAEDLSEMEIHALVDESDIGQIEVGQDVRFTVDAYYEEEFQGVVRQVRLQPETISNVVNYTVVIDAPNEKGLLLPGMTATADFLIQYRENVLLVPNVALKVRPNAGMIAALRERMSERTGSEGETSAPGGAGAGFPRMMGGGEDDSRGALWYLDDDGRVAVAPVEKGATDGVQTEIVEGRGISEGMQVISAVIEVAGDEGGSNNPLATTPFGRRRG